jgi:hypothetical protein
MVHLWYLLLNLESEKEGRQGCYILMEGLIWYMAWRCFLKALTWNEERGTLSWVPTTLFRSLRFHIKKKIRKIVYEINLSSFCI